jgi:hypothetical protein
MTTILKKILISNHIRKEASDENFFNREPADDVNTSNSINISNK